MEQGIQPIRHVVCHEWTNTYQPKKSHQQKSYKQCFNHIKEEWEKTHYLDGEYTSQNQNSSEVNKIQEWEETPTDDPQEQAFQAEVNEVFQRYGRHYNQPRHQGTNGYRFQHNRFNQNRNSRFMSNLFSNPQQFTPRHQSTTVANQAYTFNRTTAHPNVSYAPGMLNMGPMHQQWGYQNQDNQYQPYHNQYSNKQQSLAFNSFAQSSTQANPKNTTDNTSTILEQMTKLLSSLKAQSHQVQEIQAQTTTEAWDLGQAAKLPQVTPDNSE